jgi:primase-polymerase (primpol)-like protein
VVVALDSYTEVSPSGKGLKVWVRATKPGCRCSTRDTPWGGKIEVYDRGRFFAATGKVVRERPIRDAQGAVDGLYERFLGQERRAVVTPLRRPSSGGAALSDDEVRAKARGCRHTGARFAELHDNGSSVVPVGERSEADYYFCSRLAYWTGGDADQMKRLFRLSDLARGKYAEKGHHGEDYLDRTVRRAIRDCKRFYDPSEGERLKEEVRQIVYCKDCGQELWPEDRFCAGCGRSLRATAAVPTPEADVPVPPPPILPEETLRRQGQKHRPRKRCPRKHHLQKRPS